MSGRSLRQLPQLPVIPSGSRTEQVLIGSLLGDGTITKQGQFIEKHCQKQIEIVEILANFLEPLFLLRDNFCGKRTDRIKTHKSNYHNGTKSVYNIVLPQYPVFKQLRAEWYPDGKKTVSQQAIEKLNFQAIAWWYLGDGSYPKTSRHLKFATRGFSPQDNKLLAEKLQELGFISTKVTTGNVIRLDNHDTNTLLPLISEYIMPTMRYKLGPLEPTYKPYNPHHYDPELVITERMLNQESNTMV